MKPPSSVSSFRAAQPEERLDGRATKQLPVAAFSVLSVVMWACGGNAGTARPAGAGDTSVGAGDGGAPASDAMIPVSEASLAEMAVDAGFRTAPHQSLAQIPNGGGPRLQHIKLVTIDYPADPHDAAIQSFGDYVVTSNWLTTVGQDYGVGAGTHTHVTLGTPAPATLSTADIPTLLKGYLQSGALPGGLLTQPSDYLYMIYIPASTTVTDLLGGCQDNSNEDSSAYHDSVNDPDGQFAYAVIPTCSTQTVAAIDFGASHELIEAATDAYPLVTPAYAEPATSPWYVVAEVADMCEFSAGVVEGGHYFTTAWSNSAAAKEVSPCIPASASPYFNVSVAPDATHSAAAGQTVTFKVEGWSTAPVPDWTVTTSPFTYAPYGAPDPMATLSISTFNNGVEGTLAVTIPAGVSSGYTSAVLLGSQVGQTQGGWASVWPVTVQVP